MNDKEKNIIYTAADIEQYLSGKLSKGQMHAMEKAALDDDFLAEAIEGYDGMKPGDWKKGLADLQHSFTTGTAEAKVIPMQPRKNNWWKVAAAVLLLAGASTTAYLLVNKKDHPQIASETTPVKTTTIQPDSAVASATVAENGTVTGKTEQPVQNKKLVPPVSADQKNTAPIEKATDSLFVYTPAPVKKEEQQPGRKFAQSDADDMAEAKKRAATGTIPPVGYATVEKKSSQPNVASNNNAAINYTLFDKAKDSYAKEGIGMPKKEQPLNQRFMAQVVGPDNTALPFANISIKNENFGTYADVNGNFSLVSADSVLTVEVKAAGYQPRFYTLQSYVQQNKIVLSEQDVTANYKTVTGNTAGSVASNRLSRKATLLKDSVVNVEPADGWDNYNTYVTNNLDIPDDILQKNIHGKVELSFDVQSNGSITNIKVDKSLCDNCDEIARRLIEQGPQWKVKKGKNRKGKVTVQF